MSSHICGNVHFNSIEKAIQKIVLTDFHCGVKIGELYPTLKRSAGNPQDKTNTISSIMDIMRKVSVLCVNLQYKNHYVGKLDKVIKEDTETLFNDKKTYKELSDIALYKAIRCTMYQIEIKHLLELRPLAVEENNALQFMNLFSARLSDKIVQSLPKYEDCEWTIDFL